MRTDDLERTERLKADIADQLNEPAAAD